MITEYDHNKLKKDIQDLKTNINENEALMNSEKEMNEFLKTQIESLKITLETVAQLNQDLTKKLAKERVLFQKHLNKINE
jgi:hypothetical protein|tara:strand:- start:633 stop:872 length:240 start_codon:yes stop_codon:yes gene_type:complete